MPDKTFITANSLLRDSFTLARRVFDSGYRPDVMLVVWRGGTPVGMVIHEFFLYQGVDAYHTTVKASSYGGVDRRRAVRVENLAAALKRVTARSRVLLVDDIFDSGQTLDTLAGALSRKTPHVRIATLYYRPGRNRTGRVPDFFLRSTDRWIVFPHELVGLTREEIRRKGRHVYDAIRVDTGPGVCLPYGSTVGREAVESGVRSQPS